MEDNPYMMKLIDGKFLEGERVRVHIGNKEAVRVVRYNNADGLYIMFQNCKYFETDIEYDY